MQNFAALLASRAYALEFLYLSCFVKKKHSVKRFSHIQPTCRHLHLLSTIWWHFFKAIKIKKNLVLTTHNASCLGKIQPLKLKVAQPVRAGCDVRGAGGTAGSTGRNTGAGTVLLAVGCRVTHVVLLLLKLLLAVVAFVVSVGEESVRLVLGTTVHEALADLKRERVLSKFRGFCSYGNL